VTERSAGRVAWGLWAIAILIAIASVVFLVLSWGTEPPPGTFGFPGFAAMFALTFGTPGALIAARQPRNPIGWIFLGVAISSAIQELATEYAIWSILDQAGEQPLAVAGEQPLAVAGAGVAHGVDHLSGDFH